MIVEPNPFFDVESDEERARRDARNRAVGYLWSGLFLAVLAAVVGSIVTLHLSVVHESNACAKRCGISEFWIDMNHRCFCAREP